MNGLIFKTQNKFWVDIAFKVQKKNKLKSIFWVSDKTINKDKTINNNQAFKMEMCNFIKKENITSLTPSIKNLYLDNEFILFGMLERWFPKFEKSPNYFRYRRYLIKQFCIWFSFLKEKKINLIIFPSVPHRIFDYVAYLLAKELGIKVVITILTDSYKKGVIFTDNLNARSISFNNYKFNKKKDIFYTSKIDEFLYLKNYKAKHFIEKKNRFSTYNKFLLLIKKTLKSPLIFSYFNKKVDYFHINKLDEINNLYYLEYFILNFKKIIDNYSSKLYLHIISKKFSKNQFKNFIYLPLNYQYERSTNPDCNDHYDFFYILNSILNILPKKFYILIKEHPRSLINQSIRNNRNIFFYKRLLSISSRVIFINSNTKTTDLIKYCKCVVVATSTTAVESIMYGKPVIQFGNSWYDNFKFLFKYDNQININKILKSKILLKDKFNFLKNFEREIINLNRNNFIDNYSKKDFDLFFKKISNFI